MRKLIMVVMVIAACIIDPMSAYAKTVSKKDFVVEVARNLVLCNENFTIECDDSMTDYGLDCKDLFDKVCKVDFTSSTNDRDFLRNNLISMNAHKTSYGDHVTFVFDVDYVDSYERVKALDRCCDKVIKQLNLDGMSKKKKLKKICEYVVKRVSYDDSLTSFSGYEALVNRSAVCQGYSTLVYKLCMTAGIKCNIEIGTITETGEPHSWNSVYVSGKKYHVDACWMDRGDNGTDYRYFLMSEKQMRKERDF